MHDVFLNHRTSSFSVTPKEGRGKPGVSSYSFLSRRDVAPTLMALTVGSRLGHYDVTALIGEGGMGEVYQATDTTLNRQVAGK